MPKILNYESIPVALSSTEYLHLSRYYHDQQNPGTPVFMLPGILQDGGVFYTEEGTGLAGYLARLGFDVYVADLRGKGKSRPPISASSKYGSFQAITEEIPALLDRIIAIRGDIPQIWVGHGWGSILLCSVYARFGSQRWTVKKMVHFAARRKIQLNNARKKRTFRVGWKKLVRLVTRLLGYFPAKSLRLGSSNETSSMVQDYLNWSTAHDWCDPEDGFNYAEALRQQLLPPGYYFAAQGDSFYAEPDDVRAFIKELGQHDGRLMVLSRKGGNLHNYGHADLLNHQDCEKDHFPLLSAWLLKDG